MFDAVDSRVVLSAPDTKKTTAHCSFTLLNRYAHTKSGTPHVGCSGSTKHVLEQLTAPAKVGRQARGLFPFLSHLVINTPLYTRVDPSPFSPRPWMFSLFFSFTTVSVPVLLLQIWPGGRRARVGVWSNECERLPTKQLGHAVRLAG